MKKAYHASFHLLALAALVLGLAAVIASKVLSAPARGHMYTLHSTDNLFLPFPPDVFNSRCHGKWSGACDVQRKGH